MRKRRRTTIGIGTGTGGTPSEKTQGGTQEGQTQGSPLECQISLTPSDRPVVGPTVLGVQGVPLDQEAADQDPFGTTSLACQDPVSDPEGAEVVEDSEGEWEGVTPSAAEEASSSIFSQLSKLYCDFAKFSYVFLDISHSLQHE